MTRAEEAALKAYPYEGGVKGLICEQSREIFIKGYEQAEKDINKEMMDGWLKDRDGCFWDGVEEGKKAMEKQMMKDAVEASVNTYELAPGGSAYVEFVADMPVARFRSNDKVKIIILKP